MEKVVDVKVTANLSVADILVELILNPSVFYPADTGSIKMRLHTFNTVRPCCLLQVLRMDYWDALRKITIDLFWSIIVSELLMLWLGDDAPVRSRRCHWTSTWKHSERWIHSSQMATDLYHHLAGAKWCSWSHCLGQDCQDCQDFFIASNKQIKAIFAANVPSGHHMKLLIEGEK